MAYIDSYSYAGSAKGITVYDVDVENGRFKERYQVEADNSPYLVPSNDRKTLYSTANGGVVSFWVHENGGITRPDTTNIRGMKGCHLSTDSGGRYLFTSGYHDGKVTVMHLNPDSSTGDITADVYHKGLGGMAERTFRLHMSCCHMTPDRQSVMVADSGIDQVKMYRLSENDKELILMDTIPCDLGSVPRHSIFSPDGKSIHLMYEAGNVVDVYAYETGKKTPVIERIQTVSTAGKKRSQLTAVYTIRPSSGAKYSFCGNAGGDTINIYKRDEKTGMLERITRLPISGEYPKDIAMFPDDKHIISFNYETGNITFFRVDYEAGLLVMSSKEAKTNGPNCCAIVKVGK